ncbi:hypothetical protein [Kutzneria kofuensis]|uniref:hypothetical protein n=1 Tax=Kutzneria kofuensis TaxID=103725 RepID=UPI001606FC34|nr:hypothetical protein [Kutzneria kofuensis]
MDDGRVSEPREQREPTRRLDDVFGEVLPETTSDERDPERRTDSRDSWYEENRPPHHEDR